MASAASSGSDGKAGSTAQQAAGTDHLDLTSGCPAYDVVYPDVVVGGRPSRIKVYQVRDPMDEAWLFWQLRDVWQALGLSLSYARGGLNSCRHLLDRWNAWLQAGRMVGIPSTHWQKARTSSRGPASKLPPAADRPFPEHAASTFAILACMCHMWHTLKDDGHRASAKTFLDSLVSPFLADELAMPIVLDSGFHKLLGASAREEARLEVILPLRGGLLDLGPLMEHSIFTKSTKHLTLHPGFKVPVVALLLQVFSHEPAQWFATQLLHNIGYLMEADFDTVLAKGVLPTAGLQASPCSQLGKRADQHREEAIIGHNPAKKARHKREREAEGEIMKQLHIEGAPGKSVGIRRYMWRYYRASQQALQHPPQPGVVPGVALAMDASRVGGRDTMLLALASTTTKQVCWAPPQAPHTQYSSK